MQPSTVATDVSIKDDNRPAAKDQRVRAPVLGDALGFSEQTACGE